MCCTVPPSSCPGFEACLNSRVDKPAELIARYLDSILRRGSKAGAQDGSLEEVLDAALALFRSVQARGEGGGEGEGVVGRAAGLHAALAPAR